MTNAPIDLLTLRSRIQLRTGLSAVEVGIVGDVAHGGRGYHEGRSDLTRVGVLGTDYSVRLARDRAGLTESASALDIGGAWRTGGGAAWLRFNHLLIMELTGGRAALAPIRAVNYSPDGRQKLRQDRENGWRVEATSDTVDVHTHIEFYRDTEGKRQACIDYLDLLVGTAISGQQPDGDEELDANQATEAHEVHELTKWNIHPWVAGSLQALGRIEPLINAIAAKVDIGPEELAAITAAADAGAAAALAAHADELAARVVAALPADVAAGVASAVTTAVRQVFAAAAAG